MWRDAIKPLLCAMHLSEGDKSGIYINLANCYGNEGEYETALGYTNKALEAGTSKENTEKLIKQRMELGNKVIDLKKERRKK
jgi:tetratricopeptide (TPR) repeat protein